MYTGTFTYMPADKTCIYDPFRNPYYNCPAHRQIEVNLVSWRLAISGRELTYDDTQNVMIIYGHTLQCYIPMVSVNPLQKLLSHLYGLAMSFVLFLHYKILLDV